MNCLDAECVHSEWISFEKSKAFFSAYAKLLDSKITHKI